MIRKPVNTLPRTPRVLFVLFAASGCAALIYEVVWLQMLELVLGSTAASMAVLLGTFMAGMCLGSLALPRVVGASRNPVLVYATLELLAGLMGIAVPLVLPLVQHFYIQAATDGSWNLGLRALVCAICLLPPTAIMGATLPAISTHVGAARCGALYAANLLGGVLGCLGAGFWLLRIFDKDVAGHVAVGLNFAAALLAFLASRRLPSATAPDEDERRSIPVPVLIAIGLSGLTALGAEVVWTRLLALSIGPTTYTFSIILAVFLVGLGIGSAVASRRVRTSGDSRTALAWTQAGLIPALCWGAWMVSNVLPYWGKDLAPTSSVRAGFAVDLAQCLVAILPAALLWGASFPLALASGLRDERGDSGLAVGATYAANTFGAILGAVAFSVFVVGSVGSGNAERLLVVISGVAALSAFGTRSRAAAAVVFATLAAAWAVPQVPWQLLAFGRRMSVEVGPWKNLYAAEGVNSSIAYTQWVDGRRYFHVAGKREASNSPFDMKVQRLLGHMPALIHPNPKSALVVGCGAGVTAGSFVVHPEIERIRICEIEPLIPPATARFFAPENHGVMRDPRTSIVIDDARHHVLTTRNTYDIITSDPIHPWVKGAATLYTKEYFEMVRAHLNPGGIATQWVPLYESDLATVQSEIATFMEVFPDSIVWGNYDLFDQGYDVVLMGSTGPIHIDVDAVESRIQASPRLAESLRSTGWRGASDLLGTYASRTSDLRGWLKNAQINRDRSLRLQYLAGLALNSGRAGWIYGEIERRSPFPTDLFTGSPASVDAVRRVFDDWRTIQF